MTVVNPKSISGITSITTASGSDNLLTIHTSDASNTERFRIDSTGATKIVTGIVTTLTATTGIVTTFEATTGNITTLRAPTGISTHFTADKISLPDSSDGSLCIGIGSDLKFNHSGGHSYITEVGGGDLYIQGSDIILRDAGTLEKHIEMTQNGAVDIYHNGTKKLETSSNGVAVSGHLALNRQDTSNEGGEIVFNRASDNSNQWFNDVYGNDSTAKIRWHHGGAEKISFSTGGDLNIIDGNLHVASGHGIDFSATGDASGSSSELLDDYEEGTWTPALQFDVGSPTVTYGTRSGTYVKIGRMVHLQYYMHVSSGVDVNDYFTRLTLPFSGIGVGNQDARIRQWNTTHSDWFLSLGGSAPVFFMSNAAGSSANYARGDDVNGAYLSGQYTLYI
tara:strand:- start:56 stop:1234 length:1179 start_codon:yes stop_codon:yes gene_type:complete